MDNTRNFALLCVLDTLERIDIFLHEVRNIQINIIHSLRSPILLRSLRLEEALLWGQEGDEILDKFMKNELSASSAARNSGIDYPRPLKAVSELVGRVRDGIPLRREAKAIRKMYAEFF
ncbi:MAG: hypothetical protein AB7E32_03740, partial [Desulfovibrio sp.]